MSNSDEQEIPPAQYRRMRRIIQSSCEIIMVFDLRQIACGVLFNYDNNPLTELSVSLFERADCRVTLLRWKRAIYMIV